MAALWLRMGAVSHYGSARVLSLSAATSQSGVVDAAVHKTPRDLVDAHAYHTAQIARR